MRRTNINGRMLTLARESKGYSQSELSRKIKITQGKLSKIEQGLQSVNDEMLEGLSRVLDYPSNFFLEQEYIYPPVQPFPRKRNSLSKKSEKQIEAKANIYRLHTAKLLKAIDINDNVPRLELDDFNNNPDEIAIALRRYWKLPRGPIENVTKLLEEAGIVVFPMNFETEMLDGFTIVAPGVTPIIFVNTIFPGDRLRFTLCHELGHIIMHQIPTQNAEDEANRFASEFLMPGKEIKPKLTSLTIPKLASLKPYWKVSMAALLLRASRLYAISKKQAQSLWIKMAPYKKREPVEIPMEEPILFKELIRLHKEELGYQDDELRALLLLSRNGYKDLFKMFFKNEPHEKKLRIINCS